MGEDEDGSQLFNSKTTLISFEAITLQTASLMSTGYTPSASNRNFPVVEVIPFDTKTISPTSPKTFACNCTFANSWHEGASISICNSSILKHVEIGSTLTFNVTSWVINLPAVNVVFSISQW